jgi:hypothetical protein
MHGRKNIKREKMVIILVDPKNGARLGTWGLSLNSTICPFLTRMPLCIKIRDDFTNILLSLKPIDAIDSILFSCFMDKLKWTYQTGIEA